MTPSAVVPSSDRWTFKYSHGAQSLRNKNIAANREIIIIYGIQTSVKNRTLVFNLMIIQPTSPHPFPLRFILILSSHLRLDLSSVSFLRTLSISFLHAFLFSHEHSACAAHSILIQLVTLTLCWSFAIPVQSDTLQLTLFAHVTSRCVYNMIRHIFNHLRTVETTQFCCW